MTTKHNKKMIGWKEIPFHQHQHNITNTTTQRGPSALPCLPVGGDRLGRGKEGISHPSRSRGESHQGSDPLNHNQKISSTDRVIEERKEQKTNTNKKTNEERSERVIEDGGMREEDHEKREGSTSPLFSLVLSFLSSLISSLLILSLPFSCGGGEERRSRGLDPLIPFPPFNPLHSLDQDLLGCLMGVDCLLLIQEEGS